MWLAEVKAWTNNRIEIAIPDAIDSCQVLMIVLGRTGCGFGLFFCKLLAFKSNRAFQ